ncbi:superoxide dismutase family protein [Microbulbifer hydrolyticus]|uniref:Superoxide dismutase [Cu-Zn] n=1 Tax=Microbulbifer hydrolyticus TaxID=48074 RepID=A0A6P1TA60_9GAMM|nr:superoxide dismutase family protein [Microbulbifer hydrolyticus]MBB5213132.1 Cu-Zn family superoxide dismutase [Microbulbifer hydrolyticus]QHQ38661.1 superoxide dismutase [Cu-Zn] SodC2 [Microbulbifer hydrolyticus]
MSIVAALLGCMALSASAETVVSVLKLDSKGVGAMLGTVTITETPYGLVFRPRLKGLPRGLHGFHLHENGSCLPAMKDGKMVPGLAAGSHYDPKKTGRHGMPWGDGHLGDLPALYVDADGQAYEPVLAPRVKLSDLKGRALMVHAGGDNYSDMPSPLGGGGARIACGVIQ